MSCAADFHEKASYRLSRRSQKPTPSTNIAHFARQKKTTTRSPRSLFRTKNVLAAPPATGVHKKTKTKLCGE
jgi:hypothetical protein